MAVGDVAPRVGVLVPVAGDAAVLVEYRFAPGFHLKRNFQRVQPAEQFADHLRTDRHAVLSVGARPVHHPAQLSDRIGVKHARPTV